MIVTDDRVAAFVSQELGFGLCPPWTAMGIEKNGRIVAGVLFNHFEGPDLHVTIAGHGWTKGFAADVGDYVFKQLGCIRMTAITEQPAIVRIAERLGGQVEGLMRNHFGKDRHGFIVGILKDDWKY